MSKTNTKKWIRLSIILYIVILTVVAVASFAWFIFEDTATLQANEDIKISAGNKLEICYEDELGNWSRWESYHKLPSPNINAFPDISGNGKVFYCPMALDANDEPSMSLEAFKTITNSSSTSEDDSSLYMITLRLMFRTTTPMDIYLSDGSYVRGKEDVTDANRVDWENESQLGNISCDGIAGAVRVSFIEYVENSADNDPYVLKNVWVPNDKYELKYEAPFEGENTTGKVIGDDEKVAHFYPAGEREAYYSYVYNVNGEAMDEYNYTATDFTSRAITVGSTALALPSDSGVPMINESAPLLSFTTQDIVDNGGIATKTLFINVWIEGTDREADRAFEGGNLKYCFKFSGIRKDDYKETDDDGIEFSNGKLVYESSGEDVVANVLNYSFDGIDWYNYSGTMASDVAGHDYIYVRYAETSSTKASTPFVVQLSNP